jgi:hypothetical protein
MTALQIPSSLTIKIPKFFSWGKAVAFVRKYEMLLITIVLSTISVYFFFYYLQNNLGLS